MFIQDKGRSKKVNYIGIPTFKGRMAGIPKNLRALVFLKSGKQMRVTGTTRPRRKSDDRRRRINR